MSTSCHVRQASLIFGLVTSLFGLILVSVSVADPLLAVGPRTFVPMTWIPAVAAESAQGNFPDATVDIADAREMPRLAPSARGAVTAPRDPVEYPNPAVAAQSLQHQMLEYRTPRTELPAISSLYPQNAITLWDRIRDGSVRDRRAFLLGTAIQVHAPLTAARPEEWRGEEHLPAA